MLRRAVGAQQTDPGITIRARQVIDGRGGTISNATVSIKNGKIVSVGPASRHADD